MKRTDCEGAWRALDARRDGELADAGAAELAAHLAACPTCMAAEVSMRETLDRLGALSDAEWLEAEGERRLPVVRTRVLATIRASDAGGSRRWLGWAWAAAAALAAVAFLGVSQQSPGRSAATPVAGNPALAPAGGAVLPDADASADDVRVVTVQEGDAVTLRWEGRSSRYVVYKATRPGASAPAEVTVVCGKTWTDHERSPGLAYYRVVAVREGC